MVSDRRRIETGIDAAEKNFQAVADYIGNGFPCSVDKFLLCWQMSLNQGRPSSRGFDVDRLGYSPGAIRVDDYSEFTADLRSLRFAGSLKISVHLRSDGSANQR